jgi:nitroreductase
MQFYNVIENRTSVKKFRNTGIDREKVDRMLNAAMMSPSWKNASSYKFIIVEEQDKKNIIADAINNKTGEAAKSVREAPMLAVVAADPNESGVVDDKQYYLVDGAIAMEHFILAATAEGYGTCWIAAVDENVIREVLNIPKNYKIIGLTPVGEIEEEKNHYPKKETKDYVFLNSWNEAYTKNNAVLH